VLGNKSTIGPQYSNHPQRDLPASRAADMLL
jgi:hypothetical protein